MRFNRSAASIKLFMLVKIVVTTEEIISAFMKALQLPTIFINSLLLLRTSAWVLS